MIGASRTASDAINVPTAPPFDVQTQEEAIARFVDTVRGSSRGGEALAALLPEAQAFYAGRSTNETARIRGYVLAAFEQTGLPDAATPYVLEELESGREAYLVAAAAKAVRGLPRPAADIVPYLFSAIDNIRLHDDAVTFECYRPRWPLPARTTALTEIFRTFGWLGASAVGAVARLGALMEDPQQFTAPVRGEIRRAIDRIRGDAVPADSECCSILPAFRLPARGDRGRSGARMPRTSKITLQDQDGNTLSFDKLCRVKPTIVVFFYTRCDNPNKCSLSITKLARLQEAIGARGLSGRIRTLAITYEPAHDTAPLLKMYGSNRGVTFEDDHRIVRTLQGAEELYEHFDPGVNFGPSTVNRHRIELFVLDRNGEIAATFERLQWSVDRVLDETAALLDAKGPSAGYRSGALLASPAMSRLTSSGGVCASAMLALVPKCPVCWAAYLSAAGIGGVPYVPGSQSVRSFLLLLIAINVAAVCVWAHRMSGAYPWSGVLLSLCGSGAVVLAAHLAVPAGMLCGSLMVAAGAMLTVSRATARV